MTHSLGSGMRDKELFFFSDSSVKPCYAITIVNPAPTESSRGYYHYYFTT